MYNHRPCSYLNDLDQVTRLLLAYRAAAGYHLYPTLWRLRLLWTSRVWIPEQDVQLWEAPSGQAVGFALLWRRKPTSPYLSFDRLVHPAFATRALIAEMNAWGTQRAQAIAAGQNLPLTIYACRVPPNILPEDPLPDLGYAQITSDLDAYNVYCTRSLLTGFPAPSLPPSFTIRPLQGVAELEAYQSLFGFAAVNPHHQRELLASDEYSHQVVVTPTGELAAYCECSICRLEWQAGSPKIGWIDYIETRSGQQKQGLGQAALLAGLARLRDWGADTALLVTISTNMPALSLYRKVGFEWLTVSEAPGYEKHIPIAG